MELQLEILQARQRVLRRPRPVSTTDSRARAEVVVDDPFACESHGFYVQGGPDAVTKEVDGSGVNEQEKSGPRVKASTEGFREREGVRKKRSRFVTNWTPQMDKIVKKALEKHGWGCWTRIAASGKLPKEYNAKLIANRARAIGFTREMFGASGQQ